MWYEEVAEEQRCKLAVAVVVVVVVVVVIAAASRSTYTGRPRVAMTSPLLTRGITNHNNAMITLAFIRVVMIIPELPRVTLDLFKSGYFLYP